MWQETFFEKRSKVEMMFYVNVFERFSKIISCHMRTVPINFENTFLVVRIVPNVLKNSSFKLELFSVLNIFLKDPFP